MEAESFARGAVHAVLTTLALIGLFIVAVGIALIVMFAPKDRERSTTDEDHDRIDD